MGLEIRISSRIEHGIWFVRILTNRTWLLMWIYKRQHIRVTTVTVVHESDAKLTESIINQAIILSDKFCIIHNIHHTHHMNLSRDGMTTTTTTKRKTNQGTTLGIGITIEKHWNTSYGNIKRGKNISQINMPHHAYRKKNHI